MGYCQVSDVLAVFPRFQTNLPNNIASANIQSWIDQGKAVIRARFLRRGLDPDAPSTLGFNPPLTTLTADQGNVLAKFNIAYGVGRFGDSAYSQLSEGELAVVKRAWIEWESMSKETDASGTKRTTFILGNDGVYDALFTPGAAHVAVGPVFAGIAGADYDPKLINDLTLGTFHMFEKGMKF